MGFFKRWAFMWLLMLLCSSFIIFWRAYERTIWSNDQHFCLFLSRLSPLYIGIYLFIFLCVHLSSSSGWDCLNNFPVFDVTGSIWTCWKCPVCVSSIQIEVNWLTPVESGLLNELVSYSSPLRLINVFWVHNKLVSAKWGKEVISTFLIMMWSH